ncbi:hypothetical protein niasHT_026468 [Heterodera trifolii]|uniref:Uncharacterized protein n=1 Tax=Heterodera trifolii TaxID=157864 RepID=A0ABD2KJA8_9BILA
MAAIVTRKRARDLRLKHEVFLGFVKERTNRKAAEASGRRWPAFGAGNSKQHSQQTIAQIAFTRVWSHPTDEGNTVAEPANEKHRRGMNGRRDAGGEAAGGQALPPTWDNGVWEWMQQQSNDEGNRSRDNCPALRQKVGGREHFMMGEQKIG